MSRKFVSALYFAGLMSPLFAIYATTAMAADDPNKPTNQPSAIDPSKTQKEEAKEEVKDDKTDVAFSTLDEALKRNSRATFEKAASDTIDTLEARKAALKAPVKTTTTSDVLASDIDRAEQKVSNLKKASDADWKNVGMELKVQLMEIDKKLDQAEGPGQAPVTQPVAPAPVAPAPTDKNYPQK